MKYKNDIKFYFIDIINCRPFLRDEKI